MKDGFADLQKDLKKDFNSINENEVKQELIEPSDSDASIKIDVSSAEKLFANLSYAAQELSAAVAGVEKNRDLGKILDELTKLNTGDLKNFDKNLSKNLKKVETSVLQKMSLYSEAFEADDIQKTLNEIEKIEHFTKGFKFKSIVFATLLSLLIGFTTSYFTFYFYFKNQTRAEISKYKTELNQKFGSLAKAFQNVDFQIGENKKIVQIDIKTHGVTVFKDGDEKFINIPKNLRR